MELATNQGFKNIVPKDFSKVDPLFVAYMMTNLVEQMESLASGGTFKEISKTNFSTLKIPLPPLSIQQEIVAELDTYQKIINGAMQIATNYKPSFKVDPTWEMVELEDLIEFVSGLTLSIPDSVDTEGTPIISINNVTEDGNINLDGLRRIKLPDKKSINFLQKEDLLFNWRNGSKHLVGKTAFFDLEGEYVFASFLLGVEPH